MSSEARDRGKIGRIRDRLRRWWENAEEVAEHRYATGIVGGIEMVGSTILPLPVALLMVGVVTAAPRRWKEFALGATMGSVAGGIVLYIIGIAFFHSIGQSLIDYYGAGARWASVLEWFNSSWGVSFVMFASITSGLFRVSSLAAGFTAMDPLLFFFTILASRGVRWYGECAAIKYVGHRARTTSRPYYRYTTVGVVALAMMVLLVFTFTS